MTDLLIYKLTKTPTKGWMSLYLKKISLNDDQPKVNNFAKSMFWSRRRLEEPFEA